MSISSPTTTFVRRPPAQGNAVYQLHQQAIDQLTYPLLAEELRHYRQQGFIIIRNVFDNEEVAQLQEAANTLMATVIQESKDRGLDPAYNMALEYDAKLNCAWKVDPFINRSSVMNALRADPRITDRLRCIYDGYAPRLFKDKLIFKPAGGHGNPIHQDYNWWQGLPHSALSVSIALDATTQENGCTEMWSGHQRGFLHVNTAEGRISNAEINRDLLTDEEHYYVELQPGDMAIFDAFVPHAAGVNTSSSSRRAMFLSYNDSRDGEWYDAHYNHFFWYRTHGTGMSEEQANQYYYL